MEVVKINSVNNINLVINEHIMKIDEDMVINHCYSRITSGSAMTADYIKMRHINTFKYT